MKKNTTKAKAKNRKSLKNRQQRRGRKREARKKLGGGPSSRPARLVMTAPVPGLRDHSDDEEDCPICRMLDTLTPEAVLPDGTVVHAIDEAMAAQINRAIEAEAERARLACEPCGQA